MTDNIEESGPQEQARRRLNLALEITGWSKAKLAKEAGMAATTISRFLNFDVKHAPTLNTMAKVDAAVERFIRAVPDPKESIRLLLLYQGFGAVQAVADGMITIKVRGEVQAGHWSEASEWLPEDQETVTLPRPDSHRAYFGLRVRGPSMDMVYPEGTILVCVGLHDYDHVLENEDHVIVQRWDGDLVEATVKELRKDQDGRYWLWPRSTHPEHQTPIAVPSNVVAGEDDGNATDIVITAIVVADYRVRRKSLS